MTDAEWSACADPAEMLDFLKGTVGDRRCRLFTAAYCRHADPDFSASPEARAAVEGTERYVDGLATIGELKAASEAARQAVYRPYTAGPDCTPLPPDVRQATYVAHVARWASETRTRSERPAEIGWYGARLIAKGEPDGAVRSWATGCIRCVFGNPFRPVAFDPHWRSADAVGTARGVYDERAFDRLPLLADALMDAGCNDEQVIGHCRGDGPHVRGCWVVDLVLGKE